MGFESTKADLEKWIFLVVHNASFRYYEMIFLIMAIFVQYPIYHLKLSGRSTPTIRIGKNVSRHQKSILEEM